MKSRLILLPFGLPMLLAACTREYDCEEVQIQPAFINYPLADLKTLVLRRYQANDNFQTLLDTAVVRYGSNGSYQIAHDTTFVISNSGVAIREGFDWQLYVPATGKTVLISDIITEKRTGKEGHGIFSLDPGPRCVNKLLSLKVDKQVVAFENQPMGNGFRIYLQK